MQTQQAKYPQDALDRALAALEVRDGTTDFRNERTNPDSHLEPAQFPTTRLPGVSEDEWQALRRSALDAGGENGSASYTLIDLDGDGLRDLVVDSYGGGTGLWSAISVLRRQGERFVGEYASVNQEGGGGALYSLNGRGANQEATWVRLQGQVYAAWVNGNYGQDVVYLLRPFAASPVVVPTLTVEYGYSPFVVHPPTKTTDSSANPSPWNRALARDLQKALQQLGVPRRPEHRPARMCPPPPGLSAEERESYQSFGAGHYTCEIVSDLPVWLQGRCWVGRIVNWFGKGEWSKPQGLEAGLWLRQPGANGGAERGYPLSASRHIRALRRGQTLHPPSAEK